MYLTSQLVEKMSAKPGNRNHIWIYDRSGSMHHLLQSLGNDLIRLSGLLKTGDTLTLAWFSGEGGHYRVMLKGYQITGNGDQERMSNIVKANLSSLNTTCFSEVLADTVKAIEELRVAFPANTFAFSFFTDGYPVVSNYQRELEAIFVALKKLRPIIGEALFIGYGDYYNRSLLAEMTAEVGGMLVHAEELVDYGKGMEVLIKADGSRKVTIKIDGEAVVVFGTSTGQIVVYPHANGEATISDTEKEVFIVTEKSSLKDVSDDNALYSGAFVLASQGHVDTALDWLGKLGDVRLIDMLYNAFTNAEVGEAVNALHEAALNPTLRYVDGKRRNHVSKADAFCLVDALDILSEDESAYFYPGHPEWEYKRTGVARKMRDGYPKFISQPDTRCSFADLTWNKERLNLSVLTRIEGHISLPDDRSNYQLPATFDTYQWRNYTLVKDGILNVRKLPVAMSRTTFLALQAGKLIPKNATWSDGKIITLDLKRIPIMNRVIADGFDSALALAEWQLAEENAKAELKVIKALREQIAPEAIKATPFTEKYNETQVRYLETLGVRNDGSYSPPTDEEEATDYYLARTFEIKPGGWSSLPKLADVQERHNNNKSLNAPAAAMWRAYDLHTKGLEGRTKEQAIGYLDTRIAEIKERVKPLRTKVQRAKFAVLLGHRWFKEFNGKREDCAVSVGDTPVAFVLGEKKVEY